VKAEDNSEGIKSKHKERKDFLRTYEKDMNQTRVRLRCLKRLGVSIFPFSPFLKLRFKNGEKGKIETHQRAPKAREGGSDETWTLS